MSEKMPIPGRVEKVKPEEGSEFNYVEHMAAMDERFAEQVKLYEQSIKEHTNSSIDTPIDVSAQQHVESVPEVDIFPGEKKTESVTKTEIIEESTHETNTDQEMEKLFNEQFEKFETIEFRGTTFEVLDLKPEVVTHETPVLFLPGFGKTPRSYKETLFELYKSGRRVLSMTAPTEQVELSEEEKGGLPLAQATRAQAALHLLKVKNVGPVDLVGHSEGGMNGAIAASFGAEKFRHFAFIALPGVTDAQSYFEIMMRGIRNLKYTKGEKQETVADIRKKMLTDTWSQAYFKDWSDEDIQHMLEERTQRYERSEADIKGWMKERGALGGTIESMNPGKVDITHSLKDLHDSGHGVVVIAGTNDEMVPMAEYQRQRDGSTRSREDMGGLDGFLSVPFGHSGAEIDGRFGYVASSMLSALEQKYEKGA